MKKILAILVSTLTLVTLSSQAQAAFITDWSYELRTSFYIHPSDEDFATSSHNGSGFQEINFTAGSYNTSLAATYREGSLSPSAASSADNLVEVNTANVPFSGRGLETSFTTWSFTYLIYPTGNKEEFFEMSYKIWLSTIYYDDTMVLYYTMANAQGTSDKSIITDDYEYNFSLAISNDSEIGFVNDDRSYGWKFTGDELDPFALQTSISFTATSLNETAPTPEPATMLLMGAGLAGLGALKRRRSK